MDNQLSIMDKSYYWYGNLPSKFNDFIYIGNDSSSSNKEYMKSIGITHVIRIGINLKDHYLDEFLYFTISENDTLEDNLYPYFIPTYNFIENVKKIDGKLLIYCYLGVSRSVTLLCSYIMIKENVNYIDALESIRKIRPVADPNLGFVQQLRELYIKHVSKLIKYTENTDKKSYSCYNFRKRIMKKYSIIKVKSSDKNKIFFHKIKNKKTTMKTMSAESKKLKIYSLLEEKYLIYKHLDTYKLRKKLTEYIKFPKVFCDIVFNNKLKCSKLKADIKIKKECNLVKRFAKKVIEKLIENH